MITQYYTTKVSLSDGQLAKLFRAIKNSSEVKLLITKDKINNNANFNLYLTERQVKKFNKAKTNNKGIKFTISQSQIRELRKEGKGAPRIGRIPTSGKGAPRMGIPPPFIGNWRKTTGYGIIKKDDCIN